MNTIKEFSVLLCLLAAVAGIAYGAVVFIPTWCLVAYLAGLGTVGALLWRNSK